MVLLFPHPLFDLLHQNNFILKKISIDKLIYTD